MDGCCLRADGIASRWSGSKLDLANANASQIRGDVSMAGFTDIAFIGNDLLADKVASNASRCPLSGKFLHARRGLDFVNEVQAMSVGITSC